MTPNELLLWLSARGEGSWQQFRGAVQSLDLAGSCGGADDTLMPLHQRVRFNLERLGHIEFDAAGCEDGWRVVPPALALCQHAGHVTAVLCGARTAGLLKRFESAASGLSLERIPLADSPDVIRARASALEPLAALAESQKLLLGPDAPITLLSNIPPVDSFVGRREPLPKNGKDWNVRQLVVERKAVRWRVVTLDDAKAPGAQGLFCLTLYQTPKYFLREGSVTVSLPGAVGKYRLLLQRKRRFLKYDHRDRRLTVPAILRPPLLAERALILCSGVPPEFSAAENRPILTYRKIPEEVAGMTAEVLKQDFA